MIMGQKAAGSRVDKMEHTLSRIIKATDEVNNDSYGRLF